MDQPLLALTRAKPAPAGPSAETTTSENMRQLMKLRALKGEKRSLADYVNAVRKVGDAEVLSVTASSAALCTTGLAR